MNSPQANGLLHWWPCLFMPNDARKPGSGTIYDQTGRLNLQLRTGSPAPDIVVIDPEMGRVIQTTGSPEVWSAEDVAHPFYVANEPLTLAAWFKSTSEIEEQCITGIWNNNVNDRFDSLTINNGGAGENKVTAHHKGDAGAEYFKTSTTWSANIWNHAAATFSVSGGTMSCAAYLNAAGKGSGTSTNVSGDAFDTFGIGRNFDSSESHQFEGLIADVRIYKRAMTDNDIEHLYDPATRWELFKQRSFAFPGVDIAAAAVGDIAPVTAARRRFQPLNQKVRM